jgi:hypothetical protein
LVEKRTPRGFVGRTMADAPEIDGTVRGPLPRRASSAKATLAAAAGSDSRLGEAFGAARVVHAGGRGAVRVGEFVKVRITGATEYDLVGVCEE